MPHDRIHAKKPTHDVERWRTGLVRAVTERDGHCFVDVEPEEESTDDTVELRVTLAIRDLFVDRLDLEEDESPVGSRVWFRQHGGR